MGRSAGRWCVFCAGWCYCPGQRRHDTRSLQAYLGHKNIQHTVRYTEQAPDRIKEFWR
jgi:type 1 fimbriae regulatory protein FimB/type 1 fimbriae regulatory protein FimE